MQDFTHEDLTITVKQVGNTVTMAWLGQSAAKDPGSALRPYLTRFVDEVKGHELTLRYNDLDFMNSSSVKVILQFVTHLNAAGITTVITYDDTISWQRLSFQALKTFSRQMEHIAIHGE
jgi:hypothetical protein